MAMRRTNYHNPQERYRGRGRKGFPCTIHVCCTICSAEVPQKGESLERPIALHPFRSIYSLISRFNCHCNTVLAGSDQPEIARRFVA